VYRSVGVLLGWVYCIYSKRGQTNQTGQYLYILMTKFGTDINLQSQLFDKFRRDLGSQRQHISSFFLIEFDPSISPKSFNKSNLRLGIENSFCNVFLTIRDQLVLCILLICTICLALYTIQITSLILTQSG
jgi:hypothetical protein